MFFVNEILYRFKALLYVLGFLVLCALAILAAFGVCALIVKIKNKNKGESK